MDNNNNDKGPNYRLFFFSLSEERRDRTLFGPWARKELLERPKMGKSPPPPPTPFGKRFLGAGKTLQVHEPAFQANML